ncbi:class I SAM-dependent methyltransferase [Patescibacteria group bacterium]
MDVYSKIKKSWVKRSLKYNDRIEGILPKSFPTSVNKYLDDWMFDQISKKLNKNQQFSILDLGCGYGRLSKSILEKYPKSHVFGVDISKNYIELYNKKLNPRGKAKVGDIRNIPFKDESMDFVFVVTSLMYIVDKINQEKVFNEIFRVLKKNGKFMIIERHPFGYGYVTLGGLVSKIRGKKNKEINAVGYTKKIIKERIKKNAVIEQCSGIPVFTLLLPLFFLINPLSKNLLKIILKITKILDSKFGFILTPSLYISYTGQRI